MSSPIRARSTISGPPPAGSCRRWPPTRTAASPRTTPPRNLGSVKERRRRIRFLRRLAGLGVLLLPTAWVVGTDLLRRANLILLFDPEHRKGYLGSTFESLVFWAVLAYAAARRRALGGAFACLFLVLFTLAMGVEGAFHGFYNIYLSMDGQVHSK